VVGTALFVMLMASNMPTPLYAVYRTKFRFSTVELTLIFTAYAIVLIPALLVFGQLSDQVGRRRVIAAGLCGAGVSLALLAAARSTPWLFAARALQGLATGLLTAAAAAALVELEPGGDHRRAAVATVLGTNGGSAAGPLLAGVLAQSAPDRLVLCYIVGIGAVVLALVGVLTIRDPVTPSGVWRFQRPSVPADVRGAFARAALTGATVWSVGGLFLSIVPSYAAELLRTSNLALLGAITAFMLAVSCGSQVVLLRADVRSRDAQPAGLVLLIAGLGALIAAFPLNSMALVLTAAGLAGAGLGVALFGAQTEINHLAPPERRGEVTAAFMTALYGAVTVTAISTGLLADEYGLSTAVSVVGAVLALVAIGGTIWHLRVRIG
jgi:MFS family permease